MTDAEYESQRTDWRSLFVHDPTTGRTELIRGATLDDVERRLVNYQRSLAPDNLLDLVRDIASDILSDREPRWSVTQHRDTCLLIAKRVAAEVGKMQAWIDADARLRRDQAVIRAFRGIDTVESVVELDELLSKINSSNLGEDDRSDARRRYELRLQQLVGAQAVVP